MQCRPRHRCLLTLWGPARAHHHLLLHLRCRRNRGWSGNWTGKYVPLRSNANWWLGYRRRRASLRFYDFEELYGHGVLGLLRKWERADATAGSHRAAVGSRRGAVGSYRTEPEKMTLRTRALLSVTAAFLTTVGLLIAAISTSNRMYSVVFGILTFVFLIPANMWLRSVFRCPVCGTSIFERNGPFVTFWRARACAKCGTDLRNK